MAKVLYSAPNNLIETHCAKCESETTHEIACGQFVLGSTGDGGPYWLEYSILRCRSCKDISVREDVVTA
jgi:hypothetical protein